MESTIEFFLVVLLGLVLTAVLAFPAIWVARRVQLIDEPGSAAHKRHLAPTPLAGGIALFAGLSLGAWITGLFNDPALRAIFLSAAIIFGLGLVDDRFNLPPGVKLLGQLLAAWLLVSGGVGIGLLVSPQFFITLPPAWANLGNLLLSLVWLVGLTNAFNFVDSMDGLAVGLGGVAGAAFMFAALGSGQADLAVFFALVMGACLALYFFNAAPAVLFLGDSGAQTLGFILGALAIVYLPQSANQSSSWMVPVLLLGVPLFDASLVIVSRLRRGRPVYRADLDHTYHRLQTLGAPPSRAVLLMHGAGLILSGLGFLCLGLPPLPANLIFFATLALAVVLLIWLDHPRRWS